MWHRYEAGTVLVSWLLLLDIVLVLLWLSLAITLFGDLVDPLRASLLIRMAHSSNI